MPAERPPVWSFGSAKAATTPASAVASIAKITIATMTNCRRRRLLESGLSITHSTTNQPEICFPSRVRRASRLSLAHQRCGFDPYGTAGKDVRPTRLAARLEARVVSAA